MVRVSGVCGLLLCGLLVTVLAVCPGCFLSPLPPPSEAVLEGTWKLTTAQSTDLVQTFLTFDKVGQLTEIQYKIGGGGTVTEHDPLATTDVDGDNVTIIGTFGVNSLIFHGTLNADKTVINGTAGTEIKIGSITISIDRGVMALTKQ